MPAFSIFRFRSGLLFLAFLCAVYVSAQVPILTYHAHTGMNFSGELFTEHMDFLKENHYTTIQAEELLDWMQNGRPLPFRPVLITFDDNYRDLYSVAYPILKERRMCGYNFMHTDYVGRYDKCTWEQVREMDREGVFFAASHARLHLHMPSLTAAQQLDEILQSKLDIEKNMPGKTCKYFGIPYGFFNDVTIQCFKDAGYTATFNARIALTYRDDPIYEIPRLANDGRPLEEYKKSIYYDQMCLPLPGKGWTIDNQDPNFFEIDGEWYEIADAKGYGPGYALCKENGSAEWRSRIPHSGDYNLHLRWAVNNNKKVKFEIFQDDQSLSVVQVNQNQNAYEWYKVDAFTLFADKDVTIRMTSADNSPLCADAVWFEPVK